MCLLFVTGGSSSTVKWKCCLSALSGQIEKCDEWQLLLMKSWGSCVQWEKKENWSILKALYAWSRNLKRNHAPQVHSGAPKYSFFICVVLRSHSSKFTPAKLGLPREICLQHLRGLRTSAGMERRWLASVTGVQWLQTHLSHDLCITSNLDSKEEIPLKTSF